MNNEFISLGVSSRSDKKSSKRLEPSSGNNFSPVKDNYRGFLQNHVLQKHPHSPTHIYTNSTSKLPNLSTNLSNGMTGLSINKDPITPEKRTTSALSQAGSHQSIINSSRSLLESRSSNKLRAIKATKFQSVNDYLKEAKELAFAVNPETQPKNKPKLEIKSTLNIHDHRLLQQIPLPKSPQKSTNERLFLNNLIRDPTSKDGLESPLQKKEIREFFADDSKEFNSPISSPINRNSINSPFKNELKLPEYLIEAPSPSRKVVTAYGSRTYSAEQSLQSPGATHSGGNEQKNAKVKFKFGLAVNHIKIPTLTLTKGFHSPGRHFNFTFSKKELETFRSNMAEKMNEDNNEQQPLNRGSTSGGPRDKNSVVEKYRKKLNKEFQYRFTQTPDLEDKLGKQTNRFYVPTFVSEGDTSPAKPKNTFKVNGKSSFNEVVFERVFGSHADMNKKPHFGPEDGDNNSVLSEAGNEENEDDDMGSFTGSSFSDDDSDSELSEEIKPLPVRKRFSIKHLTRRVSQYHKMGKRESFMHKLQRVEKAIKERGQIPSQQNIQNDDRFIIGLEKRRKLNAIRKRVIQALSRMKMLGLSVEDIATQKIFSTVPFEKEHSEEFINAAKAGDVEKMEELILINKFLVFDFDHMHQNALHWAIKRGYVQVVEFLLDNGVDVNLKDTIGRTPLYFAIIYNQYNITKLLLLRRCDPWSTEEVNYGQLVKNNPKFKQLLSRGRQLHIVLNMSAGYLRQSVWQKQSEAFLVEGIVPTNQESK